LSRPQGSDCDIGAVEVAQAPPAAAPAAPVQAIVPSRSGAQSAQIGGYVLGFRVEQSLLCAGPLVIGAQLGEAVLPAEVSTSIAATSGERRSRPGLTVAVLLLVYLAAIEFLGRAPADMETPADSRNP
jgi:hypothetical protein